MVEASAVETKRAGTAGALGKVGLRLGLGSGSGSYSDTAMLEKVGINALFTIPLVAKKGVGAVVATTMPA